MAGAKTVVSSMWKVEDVAAARLMADFYENLWVKGLGRGEALRQAQLAMLRRERKQGGTFHPRALGSVRPVRGLAMSWTTNTDGLMASWVGVGFFMERTPCR